MSASATWQRMTSLIPSPTTLRAQWIWGVGAGVVLNGISLLLAFGSGVLAARLLGPDGLGQYAFVLAIVGAASVPAMLGLPNVVARYLAIYRSEASWGLARGLLRRANQAAGVVGMLFGLGCIAVGVLAWQGERYWLFLLAAPLVAILAWTNLRQKALQGLHHPVAAQLPEQLVKHTAFLAAGGALWLTGSHLARLPAGLMAVWLLASCLAFAVGAGLLRRLSSHNMRTAQPRYETRRWLATAMPMMFADSVGVIYGSTDIVLLGLLRSDSEVGVYQVAVRTAGLMAVVLTASNWVLAPWFANLHAGGERERLQQLVTRTIRMIFGFALAMFLVFAFWGRDILQLCFGTGFGAAYVALLVLGGARVFDVAAGPVVNLLAMTGGQRMLAWTISGSAIFNLAGCLLLIPQYGIMGAAVSTALAVAATSSTLALVVRRHLGIGSSILG